MRSGLVPRELQRIAQELTSGHTRDVPSLRGHGYPTGNLRKQHCDGIGGRQTPDDFHGMSSGLQRQPELLIRVTICARDRIAIDTNGARIRALTHCRQCDRHIG